MSSSTIKTVSHLKNSLSKELDKDGNSERCIDLINQLDGVGDMSLSVLTETLIGTVVSKFKSHDDPSVSSAAKALVKKWKQLAKQAGVGKITTAPTKAATKSKPKSVQKVVYAIPRGRKRRSSTSASKEELVTAPSMYAAK